MHALSAHVGPPALLLVPYALSYRRSFLGTIGMLAVRDYQDQDLHLIWVLKGGVVFLVDLMREITVPHSVDFMATSSYGAATESSGAVRILKDLDDPIVGRNVLIVEDIIDTGYTLDYLTRILRQRNPAS